MNRQILTILIGVLFTSNILGQVQNDVKEVLANKDLASFISFADTLSNKEKRITCHCTIFRDLTSDFKEGIFYITKSFPDTKNPAISSVYTFRVRLLADDKTIIYYELGEKNYKKIKKKEWVTYYDTLAFYSNDSLLEMLQQSFIKSFGAELNKNELFIDDFVYGEACGIIGEDPAGKVLIDKLVSKKNKEELFRILGSTNFEKQVYALDGLWQLKENGFTYSTEELKVIKNVLNKKGTIFYCHGCPHSWQNVIIATYKFKF
ncbi:MAG: hypothetical protein CVT94_15465 [Bacteroidetes bacterium HGW-Bacteroidetes-11]|jgi:hypothetical protein|nr:MAG: hypothetical protein CVT94_15465 [Bacteroidetes bacterium HGW-Bacteroidetes-11]